MNCGIAVCFSCLLANTVYAPGEVRAIDVLRKSMPEVKWNAGSEIKGDINCDGVSDFSYLGKTSETFVVASVLGPVTSKSIPSSVELLRSGNSQETVNESDPRLSKESMDYDTKEQFGANPDGFQSSKTCAGLNLSSGETDSFHFFWNHKLNALDWWRL